MTIPFPLECIMILILVNITNVQNAVKHLVISTGFDEKYKRMIFDWY